MGVSQSYLNFIAEMLEPLGDVHIKRMFGGAGIYLSDTMFALVADDELYFRTDRDSAAAFEDRGSDAFTYETAKGKKGTMPYHKAPDFLFDDAEEMRIWASRAIESAVRVKQQKN